jgi:hypothetical protein
LGETARTIAAEDYKIDKMMERTLELYAEVLGVKLAAV